MNYIDLIGYVATLVFLVSFSMKSLIKTRLINAIGSLLFLFFSIDRGCIPFIVFFGCLLVIDVFLFVKLQNVKNSFNIVQSSYDNEIVQFFYSQYKKEIEFLFGEKAIADSKKIACIFRNGTLVGLLGYNPMEDGRIQILLDFVTRQYRDYCIGRRLFNKDICFWKDNGIRILEVKFPKKSHHRYLEKVGFQKNLESLNWTKAVE